MEGTGLQERLPERHGGSLSVDLVPDAATLPEVTRLPARFYFAAKATLARKYSSESSSPWRREIFGSQPSRVRARVMSGRRRAGSSGGSGMRTISEREPVTARTSRAHSTMVHSSG